MVNEILTAAGVEAKRSRFAKRPAGTHAVWTDDITTDGPDGMPPRIFHHNVTIELYGDIPDEAKAAELEATMNARGIHWSMQDWVWIQSEQMYQKIYEFSYITKT